MIYLLRLLTRAFVAAERESTAVRLERQGFTRCDRAAFMAAWRKSDADRVARASGQLRNPYDEVQA